MGIFYKKHKIAQKDVTEITLVNNYQMKVSFLTLGGIITEISIPDLEGTFDNVVLAYENYEDYEENKGYFGALIGRTAGRIKDAKFTLDGKEYSLSKNYGENSGHGGDEGFHKQIFDFEVSSDEKTVTLKRVSAHMEAGYPGSVQIEVSYHLNDHNEFQIEYRGISDQDTLFNMTNHSYFNLSGDFSESILYHELFIAADEFAELEEDSSVSGKLLKVAGTPFDFRFHHEVGEEIKVNNPQIEIGHGYDHPFILREEEQVKVRLLHRFTGRVMEVETNHEAVVIYTQNYTDQQVIKGGVTLETRKAVAIEPQSLPIGPDEVNKEYSLLKAGKPYKKTTTYRFFTEKMADPMTMV